MPSPSRTSSASAAAFGTASGSVTCANLIGAGAFAALCAVAFATHNFALNGTFAEVARIDWATDGDALVARGPFDVVLAADVLYNKDNVAAALELWPRLLGPDSHLLLADPRRAGLRDFMLGARGTLEVVNLEELEDPVTLVHLKLVRS